MKDWRIGQTYGFVPSGDASELIIQIAEKVPFREAAAWFERTYDRHVQGEGNAYKAIIIEGGFDANIEHKPGEPYYVFSSDFSLDSADVRILREEELRPTIPPRSTPSGYGRLRQDIRRRGKL